MEDWWERWMMGWVGKVRKMEVVVVERWREGWVVKRPTV